MKTQAQTATTANSCMIHPYKCGMFAMQNYTLCKQLDLAVSKRQLRELTSPVTTE